MFENDKQANKNESSKNQIILNNSTSMLTNCSFIIKKSKIK